MAAMELDLPFEVWASGGVRTGLDALKLIVLGANAVGFAGPIMKVIRQSEDSLDVFMETIEKEFRVGMFCLGVDKTEKLRDRQLWQKI